MVKFGACRNCFVSGIFGSLPHIVPAPFKPRMYPFAGGVFNFQGTRLVNRYPMDSGRIVCSVRLKKQMQVKNTSSWRMYSSGSYLPSTQEYRFKSGRYISDNCTYAEWFPSFESASNVLNPIPQDLLPQCLRIFRSSVSKRVSTSFAHIPSSRHISLYGS